VIDNALNGLNAAIRDMKPSYRQYEGYAAHEVAEESYGIASKLLESINTALPYVKAIVDHHQAMMADSGYRLCVESVTPSPSGTHWKVVFAIRDEDGEEVDKVTYHYDLPSRRWRTSLAVSRKNIAEHAKVSIDFLSGFEAALSAINQVPESFCEAVDSAGRVLLSNARQLLGREGWGKSPINKLLDELDYESAVQLASIEDIDAKMERRRILEYRKIIRQASVGSYPQVPPAKCTAKALADARLSIAGVYFAWQEGVVTYVGKSVNISNRMSSHHVIQKHEDVSWLEFADGERDYAELYYIGLLQPSRNNGGKFKKTEPTT
jgi:hypothetical protein